MQFGDLVGKSRAGLRRAAGVLAAALLAGCAIGNPLENSKLDASASANAKTGTAQAGAPPPAPAPRGPVKVAMLLPLGAGQQLASVARAMKQAGELALFDQSGTLELVVKDDKGTPDGAKAAAEEAVREGAELILGPLLSSSVQAAAPVARAAGVPVVAFSNDRAAAGSGVFLLSFMPEQEVERIVAYAAAQGRTSFAALLSEDAYGRIAETAFARAVTKVQASTIAVERYQGSGSGMLEPTRRLAEALAKAADAAPDSEALLIPAGAETLSSLGPLLAYSRIDVARIKLLGSGGWDNPTLGKDATFVGGWYPAPDPHGWQSFSERFAKTFGTSPPRIASLAFDGVGIAMALSAGDHAGRISAASITRPSGFTGADGAVRFEADGTPRRALAVLEVQSFGTRQVDAATFETASPLPSADAAVPGTAPVAHAAPQAEAPAGAAAPAAHSSSQLN